jgi:tRNA modification GTPase
MARDEIARDTIAAIATPVGRGGIGVVRLSGQKVPDLAKVLLGRLPAPRHATVATFRDLRGERIDEGLALYFPAPHSYTGEAMLELQGHGGAVVMQTLLAACLEAGARPGEPGEFTRRAFLEGKLDLAQAEAVADLIDAASREAARSALRSLSGEFSAAVHALVARLTELRVLTEAMLDFPEEDVDSLHKTDAAGRLAAVRADLADLLGKSRQGSLLATGIRVVLAGRPNVGKSSLLNWLAGEERAIVTPVAGTTRDALREPVEIGGVPIILVDTAGLRPSGDEIERLGMERTRLELASAAVVLAVFEAGAGVGAEPLETLPAGAARIDVFNKLDLAPRFVVPKGPHATVAVSAKTGAGMDSLRDAILRAAGWSSTGESVFLARQRHLDALERAREHLVAAARESGRWEFFAEELRLAQVALGEITGELTADDLLGEIFARFCVGK